MSVRVSAVSYLNTKPFLHGLTAAASSGDFTVSLDTPAECARRFAANEVQVGLVPVSAFAALPGSEIIAPWCISSLGPVRSVAIFSAVPLEKITEVQLDFQSRTSVKLCEVLLREYWKHQCALAPADPGYEQRVSGTRAALVIGDRAIRLRGSLPYVYDLGEAWSEWTGLPFVYACWVANTPLPKAWVSTFSAALERGASSATYVASRFAQEFPGFDVTRYLTRDIRFPFGAPERRGLERFLSLSAGKAGAEPKAGAASGRV